MRAPSVKKLTEAFRDVDDKDAKLIRKFAKAVDDRHELEELVEGYAPAAAYVRQLHTIPYSSRSGRLSVVLHALDSIVEGFGIESLGERYEYVNMGESYATTLVYDNELDRLTLESWGGIVESGYDPDADREYNPGASKPPVEISEMLAKAIESMKRRGGSNMDLSDRAQAVQIYGMAFKLLWTWAHGEDNINYANFKQYVGWKPASKDAAAWVQEANDTRHRTQVMQAFKKNWPEAHDWMLKHNMGKRGKSRTNNPGTPPTTTTSALVGKLKF